ncbi:unnamed protein product [Cylicocyclus nassatus]|uniref:Uncharacterized protein n=1 Tax=Cylicocyclus nassatus TaxID=53992 RepID=A0AA36M996_CYLNA|nr:unnamed protein product [Cylicocyclus nassatus]
MVGCCVYGDSPYQIQNRNTLFFNLPSFKRMTRSAVKGEDRKAKMCQKKCLLRYSSFLHDCVNSFVTLSVTIC